MSGPSDGDRGSYDFSGTVQGAGVTAGDRSRVNEAVTERHPDAFRLGDDEFRALRRAVRTFLVATVVLFGGAITVTEIQAQQTGTGSGFGDTRILPPAEAKQFFDTHPQSHP